MSLTITMDAILASLNRDPVGTCQAIQAQYDNALRPVSPLTDKHRASFNRWTSNYVCAYCEHIADLNKKQCANCGARAIG